MNAFYQRVVLDSAYADMVRRLHIDNELYMLSGARGAVYAEYIGVDRARRITELEAEKASLTDAAPVTARPVMEGRSAC